jgi:hypothetical protein
MSKAEERALEKYPLMSNDDKEGLEALKYIGMECECAPVFNEVQEVKQAYFIEGYNQAQKDLELGWEDMMRIDEIITQVFKESKTCQMEAIYQEVLKRFKERKGDAKVNV